MSGTASGEPSGTVSGIPSATGSPTAASDGSPTTAGGLLTAGDVGGGLAAVSPPRDAVRNTIATALPCTPYLPAADGQVPPASSAQAAFATPNGSATVVERVLRYTDLDVADRARSVIEAGLDCRTPTVDGQAAVLNGPQDVRSRLQSAGIRGLDVVETWTLSYAVQASAITLVQSGEVLLLFQFTADNGATPDVNAQTVITTAVDKALQD